MTIRQVNLIRNQRKDLNEIARIVLIGRIVDIKDMVGRTQVIISDQTGMATIIEGQGGANLQEDSYFRFIVTIRIDKD